MKSLTPLLLIILSGTLVYWFTYPMYGEVKQLREQTEQIQTSLARAQKASQTLMQKQGLAGKFTDEEKAKLEILLPDRIDALRWIVQLDEIASRHNGKITDLKVADDLKGTIPELGISNITFKVTMMHDDFLDFLADTQRSLKLTDVTSANFEPKGTTNAAKNDYFVNLRAYWLK
jgi:hypothetical protein